MAYEIVWTKNAREDFHEIIKYLRKDWSHEIAENFVIEFYSKLDIISNYPFAGTVSLKEKDVRKILITKHNALYYKIEKDTIRLLDFFDTRQDPEKDKHT
jgi:plasmid stabilization system protein ParE